LKKLSLSDNEISEISDDINKISQLVELDISRNGEYFSFEAKGSGEIH
jgi:Leucine-rich repeat (LRR) protein